MIESLVDKLRRLDKEWDKPVDFQGYSAVVMSARELLRSGAGKWEVDAEARETFVLLIDALPKLLRLVEAAREFSQWEARGWTIGHGQIVGVDAAAQSSLQEFRAALAALDAPKAQT